MLQFFLKISAATLLYFSLLVLPCRSAAQQATPNRDSLLQVLSQLPDDSFKVKCLGTLAASYIGRNPDSLFYYANEMELLSAKVAFPIGQVSAANFKGIHASMTGDLEKSFAQFEQAYKLSNQLGLKKGAKNAFINITNILVKLKQYDKALVNFKKMVEDSEKSGQRDEMLFPFMNMSVIYQETGQFEEAYRYNEYALKIAEEMKDYITVVSLLQNRGNIFSSEKKYAESENCYRNALALCDKHGLSEYVAQIKLNLAKGHADQGAYAEAKNIYEEILVKSDTGFVNFTTMMDTYLALIEAYEKLNQFEDAYKNLRKYLNWKEKIYTDSVAARVNEFNVKYETEVKNNQIIVLKKDGEINAIALNSQRQQKYFAFAGIAALFLFGGFTYHRYRQRKKLSEQLSESLHQLKMTQQQVIATEKEKETEKLRVRISRDIHDDIGSHLSKMALHSELISAGNISDANELKNSLQSIAENSRTVISSLGEIVWAVSPNQDSLQSLLEYMRRHLDKFLKDTGVAAQINFPDIAEDFMLMPDVKRNLFLVFKEAVNNAVKYARAKNIFVSFKQSGLNYKLTIRDDGKGFNVADAMNKGNGLNNMRERMKQVNSMFEIQSESGNGCTVTVKGQF